MVFGLAYSSRAVTTFCEDSLLSLADGASARNQQLDITGYLYFRDGFFMQYLEGPQTTVEALMTKIQKDPRHQILSTIALPSNQKRVFPHWYMRYLGADLPRLQRDTLEDELSFILKTSSQENYHSTDVADAVVHVTQRIAALDW